jgi:uncharacterized membrane protein YcaP (DUF421 family)
MDAVIRALVIYLALIILFRGSGKRTLAQATTFDFVLLLIVAEATQQALLGEDFSLTYAVIVVATLIAVDRIADFVSFRFPRVGRIAQSVPVVLLENGRPREDRMRRAHVNVDGILDAARQSHGIGRLDQIQSAVLERSGGISIIPRTST